MQLLLIGRVMTDGRLSARVKADLTEKLVVKANAQVNTATLDNIFILGVAGYYTHSLYNIMFVIFVYFLYQITNEQHQSQAMFNFDYMVRKVSVFNDFLSL